MDSARFRELTNELQVMAKNIPNYWGCIQNDAIDNNLNLFEIHSNKDLENRIHTFPESTKNYFRRRWFIWKCAQCDEYLFSSNPNVKINPNPKDQLFDVEFNDDKQLRFDIKGTVIPKEFRGKARLLIQNPIPIIDFYYQKQSIGIRHNIQNRLFIIHHSFIEQSREKFLRCAWQIKERAYKEYCLHTINTKQLFDYKYVKADVIFIIENIDKSISYYFPSRSN
jgi:hypothetical protein